MSSSILSWQTLTAHAKPFRGARDLAFCLKVPLDSLLVWASSGGSDETARTRRLAWTFAARIGYKYQIRLTRSKWRQLAQGNEILMPTDRSLRSFVTSFKKISFRSDEILMTTGTSCHFGHLLQVSKKISLKSDFIHFFFMILYMYIALGQRQTTRGQSFDANRNVFIHLLQVSITCLWSLILYNFFHDLNVHIDP